jgi:hypothetical protein
MEEERSQVPRAFGDPDAGHPKYRENVNRPYLDRTLGFATYVCETECCSFCGKPVRSPRFYGYHYYGSTYHQTPTENGEEEPIDAVGFYPIGSDCAKRLRKLVPVYDASFKRLNPEVEAPRVDGPRVAGGA